MSESDMQFMNSKLEMIRYLFKNRLMGTIMPDGRRCFDGKDVIRGYRSVRHEIYCHELERERFQEMCWVAGFSEGLKAGCKTKNRPIPEIEENRYLNYAKIEVQFGPVTPPEPLSRIYKELAKLEEEGVLVKIKRGLYTFKQDPDDPA